VRRLFLEKEHEAGLFALFLKDATDPEVARALYELLKKSGRGEEARRVERRHRQAVEAEFGLTPPPF